MTVVWTAVFGVLFFALIMVSVALHEVGHMMWARLFGVRVPEFFVGFGPRVWSIKRGETEYGLKWFPLGGYVRLLGMYPPENPNAKRTPWQDLSDGVRAVEWEQITPADVTDQRLVYQKKTYQKVLIMSGGPLMNVLIAFAIFMSIGWFHGAYEPSTTVSSIQACVITEARTDLTCRDTDPPSPAARAGLQEGDSIVAFNQTAIASYPQLVDLIRANRDGPISLTVVRAGQRVTLPTVNGAVATIANPQDATRTIEVGWIGVRPQIIQVRQGPIQVLGAMWTMTVESAKALVDFPVRTFMTIADLVAGKQRDVNGPMSIVGASVAAGEIATSDTSVESKVIWYAALLASVNLFLAVFNLVPLPPLDGGHIAGALWEGLRRAWARLRKRPEPAPFDTAKLVPVAYAVGAFLLLCGVALMVADVISPVKLF